MIEAKEVLCSENPSGDRLMTMLARYPKFVHSEHLRHRAFSFSVSSSRAIPVAKNLEEVRSDELRAAPVWWGREQKGMQSGEELDDDFSFAGSPVLNEDTKFAARFSGINRDIRVTSRKRQAWEDWKRAALNAADTASRLQCLGAHKSIVNRILEPFLHVNVLITGTTAGWMNFFGLRLDRAAQPEIRALAEAQWRVWNESRPQKLEPGQWHLPFVDNGASGIVGASYDTQDSETKRMIKVSVARCARLSYQSFETGKRSTIEEDLRLYDRLVGSSPIHASPAEHQATPDTKICPCGDPSCLSDWQYKCEAGNLGPGWRQYRKMLPGEAVAPLPEGYSI